MNHVLVPLQMCMKATQLQKKEITVSLCACHLGEYEQHFPNRCFEAVATNHHWTLPLTRVFQQAHM